jgi:hypothetical protein
MITMTPKNIMNKFFSVPIYSTSGVIALAGLFFIVPGGIFILTALCLCWVADRITTSPLDHIDTTIEEYEAHFAWREDVSGEERDEQQIWDDFYGEEDDAKDDTTEV